MARHLFEGDRVTCAQNAVLMAMECGLSSSVVKSRISCGFPLARHYLICRSKRCAGMVQVGYGDITPATALEEMTAVFLMLIGAENPATSHSPCE